MEKDKKKNHWCFTYCILTIKKSIAQSIHIWAVKFWKDLAFHMNQTNIKENDALIALEIFSVSQAKKQQNFHM